MLCGFGKAWIGPCKNEVPCQEHKDRKCASCGAPATHECKQTGQFVCGAPLCDDCEHTLCEDGSNGGIGFVQTSSLPENYKSHCKKTEQVYKPWYTRTAEK